MKYKSYIRTLSALLVVCLLGGLLPSAYAASDTVYVAASGDDTAAGDELNPFATLGAAYAAVNDGGIIVVLEDVALSAKLVLNQNKAVTIDGQGNTVTYTSAATIAPDKYGLLTVEAGAVTLENITVQMPTTPGANGRVLYIGTDGTVSLGAGATLANGYLGYGGGGVLVNGGTFTMGDGAAVKNSYIVNNTTAYGGGVQVAAGTFTMTGGDISGNTIHTTQGYANYGGGVAVLGGAFRMTGGTIGGNKVDTAGGGVYLGPGGVLELGGAASITGNTVAGITNNLYLPTINTTFEQVEAATGTIGVTHGAAAYDLIIGTPGTIIAADEAAYSYDTGAYDIRLKNGNLVLYKWTVGVTINGTDFESSFTDVETSKGEDFNTTLTPDAGYQLPEDITVSVGGAELGSGEYTYDPSTGAVHIPGAAVTDDIIISVGPNALHTITVTLAHVDADTTTATVIQGDTTTITFTPANRFALPATVSVTGPCDHSYAAGVLTIYNVSGDVEVSATGAEVPHTIHLDAAGGAVAPATVTINESQPTIGGLPTPSRIGYTFTGWFTASGDRVTATTANHLTADLYLTARWSADTNIGYQAQHWVELVDSGANPDYTVGITATQRMEYQGKARTYYLQSSQQYNDGIASGHKDITPLLLTELAGLDIKGLTPSGANIYNVTMAPDGSSVYPFFYDRAAYTLSFDPNGGTIAQGNAKATILHGSVYGALPPASRPGYTLSGWYTSSHGGTKIAASDVYHLAGNQTLYAHWTTTGATAYTVTHMVQKLRDNLVGYDKTPDNYSVYLTDALNGNADATVDVYALAMPGYTPSPENVYTAFVKADGTGNVTLYYDRMITTVEYHANGGTLAAPGLRMLLYSGGVVSSLAAPPSRSGYNFDGWYAGKTETALKATVGLPLAELDPIGGQTVTLYAHWTKQTPPIPPTPPSGGGTSVVKPPATVTGKHTVYIKGYPDGNVGPMNEILRCEAAAIFYRLLGSTTTPTGKLTFPDVSVRSWYGEAVAALADMGIITGYSNGNFGPYDPITRAEFAAMAARFAGAIAANSNELPFDDIGRHWAKKYIVQAADLGWVQGDGSGHYRPDGHMTRAETVTLVNRVFGRNVTAAGMLPGMVTFPDNTPGAWYYADIQEAANSHDFTRAAAPTNSAEQWTSCGKGGN